MAQQVCKQLIDAAAVGAPAHVLEALGSGFTTATHDFQRGVEAFLSKSAPRFEGD